MYTENVKYKMAIGNLFPNFNDSLKMVKVFFICLIILKIINRYSFEKIVTITGISSFRFTTTNVKQCILDNSLLKFFCCYQRNLLKELFPFIRVFLT